MRCPAWITQINRGQVYRVLLLTLFAVMALVGCARSEGPTMEIASVGPPTATQVTVPPVPTLPATFTPSPPPPTAIATNTAAPTPTPTATPSPTPTATPTPVNLSSPADFVGRNPLTGVLVEDPAVLERRPLAVKISNSPAEWVRPQAGLSQADLVFEHVTEGPITRFTAIFYTQTPPAVGPIRSARLIDLELCAMYDAGLVFSGASIGVSRRLYQSDFVRRLIPSQESGYYRTGEDKPYEHTLYGDVQGFWAALERKGENHAPDLGPLLVFSSDPPDGGQAASAIKINYRNWTVVDWEYDPSTGRYLRWADGEVHSDVNTGDQLSAENVVVIFAVHQLDESICEFQQEDKCLAGSVHINLLDWGDAIVLRDGMQFDARWQRRARADMLTLYDKLGNPLPLQIGPTWFQVVPYHYDEPVTILP